MPPSPTLASSIKESACLPKQPSLKVIGTNSLNYQASSKVAKLIA